MKINIDESNIKRFKLDLEHQLNKFLEMNLGLIF